jgi:hypothetical protein
MENVAYTGETENAYQTSDHNSKKDIGLYAFDSSGSG